MHVIVSVSVTIRVVQTVFFSQTLAYLWRRNQAELLSEMVLVKVAAIGLSPENHLGHSISSLKDYLISLEPKYGCNPCGEGGEYETLTLDCPLFQEKLVIDESETVMVNADPVLSVAYFKPTKIHLEPKTVVEANFTQQDLIRPVFEILRTALEKRNVVVFPEIG